MVVLVSRPRAIVQQAHARTRLGLSGYIQGYGVRVGVHLDSPNEILIESHGSLRRGKLGKKTRRN